MRSGNHHGRIRRGIAGNFGRICRGCHVCRIIHLCHIHLGASGKLWLNSTIEWLAPKVQIFRLRERKGNIINGIYCRTFWNRILVYSSERDIARYFGSFFNAGRYDI